MNAGEKGSRWFTESRQLKRCLHEQSSIRHREHERSLDEDAELDSCLQPYLWLVREKFLEIFSDCPSSRDRFLSLRIFCPHRDSSSSQEVSTYPLELFGHGPREWMVEWRGLLVHQRLFSCRDRRPLCGGSG